MSDLLAQSWMLITGPCRIQLAGIPVAAEAGGRGFLLGDRNLEA